MTTARERFGGKVAAITGGASGLGEGIARHAASLGMAVAIADVDGGGAERVADELATRGVRTFAMSVDVRDAEQVDAFARHCFDEFEGVDLIVNNAGVEQFGYLWETPLADWRRVIDINVSGVFHGVRAFVPRMAARGRPAHIWNVASVGAVKGLALQAPYLMSKHAVLGMTEALKLDIEQAGLPISVAAVLPGAVATGIFDAAGSVDESGGDRVAAEAARRRMRDMLPHAQSPIDAAQVMFDQAAAGEFYLLPQRDYARTLMRARGEQLAEAIAPFVRQPGRTDA